MRAGPAEVACRWTAAVILLVAGVGKWWSFLDHDSSRDPGLGGLPPAAALLLGPLEVLLATGLMGVWGHVWMRRAASIALWLAIAGVGFSLWKVLLGRPAVCGCFGAIVSGVRMESTLRGVLLLSLAGIAADSPSRREAPVGASASK